MRRFSPTQKLLILRRANYECEICGTHLTEDNFEADHKNAYSKGGPTEAWNALALCKDCNRRKSDKPHQLWLTLLITTSFPTTS